MSDGSENRSGDDERADVVAERLLRSLRSPGLVYRDPVYIDPDLGVGDWVAVSVWGAPDELGPHDDPEPAPIRLRVGQDEDNVEAETYLSTADAEQVIAALQSAIEKALTFPQPELEDHQDEGEVGQ